MYLRQEEQNIRQELTLISQKSGQNVFGDMLPRGLISRLKGNILQSGNRRDVLAVSNLALYKAAGGTIQTPIGDGHLQRRYRC